MTSGPEQDSSVARFYSANPITIWVGSGDDGAYGVYARTLAKHMPRHIPGRPEMRVAFMGEKAGFVLTNKLANEMPRDGTVIGAIRAANMVESILNPNADVHFDTRKLGLIGTVSRQGGTVVTWHTSTIRSIEDCRARDVPTGAESPVSNIGTLPNILNALLGTRFRTTYNFDKAGLERALESGQVEAVCGLGYNTLLAAHSHWLQGNKINILAHTGLDPDPLIPGVPRTLDFASSEDDRNVIRLMDTRQVMGRPYTTTPGVPAERLSALRTAFQATMTDPQFVAEAKSRNMIIDPIDHIKMAQIIDTAYAMPKPIIARTWAMLNGQMS